MKEVTYTFTEFLDRLEAKDPTKYTRGERRIKEYAAECGTVLTIPRDYLPEKYFIQSELRKVMRSETLTKIAVLGAAIMLFKANTNMVYAAGNYQAGLDNMLYRVLEVARALGKGICVVLAIKEIITEAMRGGGFKEIGLIFIKFAVILASLYFIPAFYDEIPTMFEF